LVEQVASSFWDPASGSFRTADSETDSVDSQSPLWIESIEFYRKGEPQPGAEGKKGVETEPEFSGWADLT
jgi:hypothetical protein